MVFLYLPIIIQRIFYIDRDVDGLSDTLKYYSVGTRVMSYFLIAGSN